MITIGKRLREIRQAQKQSMRSIAKIAGISPAYLLKIERDEANPTVDILSRLSAALGIDLDNLTLGMGEPEKIKSKTLADFIEEYSPRYPELLDLDMQHLLSCICFQGRYPTTSEDWLMIFLNIRRALFSQE